MSYMTKERFIEICRAWFDIDGGAKFVENMPDYVDDLITEVSDARGWYEVEEFQPAPTEGQEDGEGE